MRFRSIIYRRQKATKLIFINGPLNLGENKVEIFLRRQYLALVAVLHSARSSLWLMRTLVLPEQSSKMCCWSVYWSLVMPMSLNLHDMLDVLEVTIVHILFLLWPPLVVCLFVVHLWNVILFVDVCCWSVSVCFGVVSAERLGRGTLMRIKLEVSQLGSPLLTCFIACVRGNLVGFSLQSLIVWCDISVFLGSVGLTVHDVFITTCTHFISMRFPTLLKRMRNFLSISFCFYFWNRDLLIYSVPPNFIFVQLLLWSAL